MAGSDTTARAFRGTLLYLMSTPQAYSTLQKEIDAASNAGRISQPATALQCRDLPYLQV
jgi:cytochrome P450